MTTTGKRRHVVRDAIGRFRQSAGGLAGSVGFHELLQQACAVGEVQKRFCLCGRPHYKRGDLGSSHTGIVRLSNFN